jgi:hypothetical protein
VIVFSRKGDCTVCNLPSAIRDAVNRAIWDQHGTRFATYIATATRVGDEHDRPFSKTAVGTHVTHVESSWREATRGKPAGEHEEPLHPTFQSVTGAAATLGVKAMGILDRALEGGEDQKPLDPKDVIAIAKLGVNAASAAEASRLKGNDQKLELAALFGLSSRHFTVPETEVGAVAPGDLDDLFAHMNEERAQLTARAAE